MSLARKLALSLAGASLASLAWAIPPLPQSGFIRGMVPAEALDADGQATVEVWTLGGCLWTYGPMGGGGAFTATVPAGDYAVMIVRGDQVTAEDDAVRVEPNRLTSSAPALVAAPHPAPEQARAPDAPGYHRPRAVPGR